MVNSLACAKYVLDAAEIKIDSSTHMPLTSGVPRRISDIDRNAIHEAVRVKNDYGGKVTVLTVGTSEARKGLREALAIGADDAHLVEDSQADFLDASTTAQILAAAIHRLGEFDLIFTGEATIDGSSSQVGPRIAEQLKIPQATYVKKLDVQGENVVAERDLEDCYEVVKAKMPLLISVTREINTPKPPPLTAILKASKKEIGVSHPTELGVEYKEIVQISRFQGAETHRKGIVIKDKPPSEAAQELVNALLSERILGDRYES